MPACGALDHRRLRAGHLCGMALHCLPTVSISIENLETGFEAADQALGEIIASPKVSEVVEVKRH